MHPLSAPRPHASQGPRSPNQPLPGPTTRPADSPPWRHDRITNPRDLGPGGDDAEVQMTPDVGMPAGVSRAFEVFGSQAGAHAAAWMDATRALSGASALDAKTRDLAYLAVLAALRLESGV